jgi:hypothetical protein
MTNARMRRNHRYGAMMAIGVPELEAVLPWAAGAVAGAVLILAGLVLATLGYRRPGLAPPPPGPPAPRAG